jgi:excinuclease ABC subunit B
MPQFEISKPFEPAGDQPKAINALTQNVNNGLKYQTLLGVTGSGKTFTLANVIQNTGKPTLVIAHNKTLAAQLASEFRQFFPNNAVHYFVSYYDYYQPEAYIPKTDTYIEKDSSINDEIDRLRNAATQALMTRKDVIIVASVSCIYGLGSPDIYMGSAISVKLDENFSQTQIARKLSDIQYERNDIDYSRGKFRIKGDILEVYPAYDEFSYRISFLGTSIESIQKLNTINGHIVESLEQLDIYPARHYLAEQKGIEEVLEVIETDMTKEVAAFKKQGKLIEAQRLQERTNFDLEILRETGFCNGIENYSRYFDRRTPGSPPSVLLDYFPSDFLMVIDESHMTIPQIRGMYNGDKARKETLIDYGFRLNAAKDNRPLKFEEFMQRVNQVIFTSATPSEFELELCKRQDKKFSNINFQFSMNDQNSNSKPNQTINQSENKEQRASVPLSLSLKERVPDRAGEDTLQPTTYNLQPNTPASSVVEQIIRPTGLIDPIVEVRPTNNQVDNLIEEIRKNTEAGERTLVTTLTKRMAEDLTSYLKDLHIKVQYLHSDVQTLERSEIIRDLRSGEYDVIIGINLLREGLDMPEVTLVAILDADREGFLRNATSLIQTFGRAARNVNGRVIMYGDTITKSMQLAIDETDRRRKIQVQFNLENHITPQTILKSVPDKKEKESKFTIPVDMPKDEARRLIRKLQEKMEHAAQNLQYEKAAEFRDEIDELKRVIKS